MVRINIDIIRKSLFILLISTSPVWSRIEYTESFISALKIHQIVADKLTGEYLQQKYMSIPPRLYDEIPFQFGCISNTADLEFRVQIMTDDGQAPELIFDQLMRGISSENYTLQSLDASTLEYYNADFGYFAESASLRPNFTFDYKRCRLYLLKNSSHGYLNLIFLMNSADPATEREISKLKYWLYFMKDVETEYAGLGIKINVNPDNEYVIDAIIKGYGAYDAGLLPLDVITQINGQETREMESQTVVGKLKGLSGTSVKLKIRRDSTSFWVFVKREKIDLTTDIIFIGPEDIPEGGTAEPFINNVELCDFLDKILISDLNHDELKGEYLGRDPGGVESWLAKEKFPGSISGEYIRVVSFGESKHLKYIFAEDVPYDQATNLYDEILQMIYGCIGGMYVKGETTTDGMNRRITYLEHALRGNGGSVDKMPVLKLFRTGNYTVGIDILLM